MRAPSCLLPHSDLSVHFLFLSLLRQSPPLFVPPPHPACLPPACRYVGGRPSQSLQAVAQTGSFSSWWGQTRSSGSRGSCCSTRGNYSPASSQGFVVSLLFLTVLTFLLRSERLDVRMPSTGTIRWRFWAPLVLLALVPGVPSKAQDQGKCSPPPCFSLFCFSPSSYTTLSPGDLRSVSPDLYPSSPSSPLLTSPPHSSASAVFFFHIISLFDVQTHSPHYTSASPPFHPSLSPVYTHVRGV